MNTGPVPADGAARPFPGLRPFGYEDRDYYFGRTAQIYALYRLLDRSRFVAAVGSSGSGKSSLVFAGLRPLLERDSGQAGGRAWLWSQMSPKNSPIEGLIDLICRLAAQHQPASDNDPSFLTAQRSRIGYLIRLSSQGLVDALSEIEGLRDKTLVLLVDQFEELFRYAKPPQGRAGAAQSMQREEAVLFVQLLLAASRDPTSRIHIILTMRSDFIGDCAAFRGLPEAVSESQFLVPGLTRDQLEEIIKKPIEKSGATIDSRLVERLLNDVSDEADQLPVLQHCLLRLWEAAGKPQQAADGTFAPADAEELPQRHITIDHYDTIGRIAEALSRHADEVLARLSGLERVVERVFRALSTIDKEGRATRREITFSRLIDETGDGEQAVRTVLERFRADDCSFLRPPISETPALAPDTPVDVGHEALLRRWEKVRGDPEATGSANDTRPIGWLREEEEDGRHYQALLYLGQLPLSEVAATTAWWNRTPRTAAWAERYGGGFSRVEALIDRGQAELKSSQAAVNAEQARRLKLKRLVYAVCALLVLNVIGAAVVAVIVNQKLMRSQQYSIQVGANLIDQSLKRLLTQLDRGDVSLAAATDTAGDLEKQFGQMQQLQENSQLSSIFAAPLRVLARIPGLGSLRANQEDAEIKALGANLALTLSDIYATVGDDNKAYDEAKTANDLAEQLANADPNNTSYQVLVYGSLFRMGDMFVYPGDKNDVQKGLAAYQQAQKIALRLATSAPDNGDRQYDLAFIDNKVGETLQQLGQTEGVMPQYDAALQIATRIAALPNSKIEWQAYPASTLTKIGRYLIDNGSVDDAIAKFTQAIAMQTDILQKSTTNNDIVVSNLLTAHRLKGNALVKEGKTDASKFTAAFAEFDDALKLAKQLIDKDSGNADWQIQLTLLYDAYGAAKKASGDTGGALAEYDLELQVWQNLVGKDRTNSVWQKGLTRTQKKIDAITAASAQATAVTPPQRTTATPGQGSAPTPPPAASATLPQVGVMTPAQGNTGTVGDAKP